MLDGLSTYKIWAPDNSLWAAWAKPVLFLKPPADSYIRIEIPLPTWTTQVSYDTAIIVDRPAEQSVIEGLALARIGYRPVPLYNCVSGQMNSSVIYTQEIVNHLFFGAELLQSVMLPPTAPPVFLLDSERMNSSDVRPGKFDNRWCIFPQDMPSAAFLKSNGIRKVILYSDGVADDLSHVLCRYQEEGIELVKMSNQGTVDSFAAVRPSKFKSLAYRLGVVLKLRRNANGGFGGTIPEPQQSSSGNVYIYHRYG